MPLVGQGEPITAGATGRVLQGRTGFTVGRARCSHTIDDLHGRCQQAGQLRAPRLSGQRCVGHRQTEEAGEADGLHGGPDGFKRTTHGLAAHIDAEGGLHFSRLWRSGFAADAQQPLRQIALVPHLQRHLPDLVDQQRLLGILQHRRGLAPGLLQGGERLR